MIETEVTVAAVGDGQAWVIPARQSSACGSCASQEGCGVSVWQKLTLTAANADETIAVAVEPGIHPVVGDRAIVSLAENAYVLAMLKLYLLPLLVMLLAAGVTQSMGVAEPGVILAALLGLGFGLLMIKVLPASSERLPMLTQVVAAASSVTTIHLAS